MLTLQMERLARLEVLVSGAHITKKGIGRVKDHQIKQSSMNLILQVLI